MASSRCRLDKVFAKEPRGPFAVPLERSQTMHEAEQLTSWEDEVIRLKQIRNSLGLTAGQVAKGASLDRSTISAYETLRSRPQPRVLRAWQEALTTLARERRVSCAMALQGLSASPTF